MFDVQRCLATVESGGVQRYHAVPSVLEKQRVDSHAWSVSMILLCLTGGEASAALIMHALLHDSAELFTGDIPFTIKRQCPELKHLLSELEDTAHQHHLFPLPDLTPEEMQMLKVADTLDGWRWCQQHEPRGPVADRWSGAYRVAHEKFSALGLAFWNRADDLYRGFAIV